MKFELIRFSLFATVLATALTAGANCAQDFSNLQYQTNDLSNQSRATLSALSNARQVSTRLRQDLAPAPIPAPQFANGISSQVNSTRTDNAGVRQSLGSATSTLTNEYEAEFKNAMDMSCVGHCSPGITDSLNRMHDMISNALRNIAAANSQSQSVDSSLNAIAATSNQAQSQVNSMNTSNGAAVSDAQRLDGVLATIYDQAGALAGQVYGNSLPQLSTNLNTFGQHGCISPQ